MLKTRYDALYACPAFIGSVRELLPVFGVSQTAATLVALCVAHGASADLTQAVDTVVRFDGKVMALIFNIFNERGAA